MGFLGDPPLFLGVRDLLEIFLGVFWADFCEGLIPEIFNLEMLSYM